MSNVYFRFLDANYWNTDDEKLYFTVDYDKIIENELWSDFNIQWDMFNLVNSRIDEIDDDTYVLCILYYAKDDQKFFTDFQFGVTETFKNLSYQNTDDPEDIWSALNRSLGEELGLNYDDNQEVWVHKTPELILSIIDITKTKLNKDSKSLDNRRDYKNKTTKKKIKMGIIVYGTEKEILEYLNNNTIKLDKSVDKIAGIVGVKFKDIQTYFYSNNKPITGPGIRFKIKRRQCNVKYFVKKSRR